MEGETVSLKKTPDIWLFFLFNLRAFSQHREEKAGHRSAFILPLFLFGFVSRNSQIKA